MTSFHIAEIARNLVGNYGFHLVDMPAATKAPRRPNWQVETIHDADAAEQHWRSHESDNMGVVLGPSRLCSLDADDLPATRDLLAEFGVDVDELARTHPTVQGNPERFRVLFRVPDGIELSRHALNWPSRADPTKNAVVFELRAGPVQDVLPPSLHPDGMRYRWLTKPANGFIAEIPPRLLTIWRQWDVFKRNAAGLCPWSSQQSAQNAPQAPPPPREGGSVIEAWNAAHSLESTLAAYGYEQIGRRWLSPHSGTKLPGVVMLDPQRCFIHHASDPLCSDDSGKPVNAFDLFAHYEHSGDLRSAVKAAADALGLKLPPREPEPRRAVVSDYVTAHPDMLEGEPWPEPIDVFTRSIVPELKHEYLPPELADFVFDQSEIMGSDPGTLAIGVLVACAAATHDSLKIRPKLHDRWTEEARLWGGIVGEPGLKKTPPLKRAMGPLRRLDIDAYEDYRKRLPRYDIEKKRYAKQEARAVEDPNYPIPDAPEKPARTQYIVEDTTIEALAVALTDNPGGILAFHDELSGFFGSMDAYRANGGKDRAFWLQAYGGGAYNVNRIGRESIPVPNLSVSILGGIQPEPMRKIAARLDDDGLLQRFMLVMGQEPAKGPQDRAENREAVHAYRGVLEQLVRLRGRHDEAVKMGAGAMAVREMIDKRVRTLAGSDVVHAKMRSHVRKWEGLFPRLCLTYHAISCANLVVDPLECTIDDGTAGRVGLFLFEYLLGHLRAFYDDVLGQSGAIGHAQWIAGHILAHKTESITNRELYRSYRPWRGLPDQEKAGVIGTLELSGWVRSAGRGRPGLPETKWFVNPQVHVFFEERASQESARREAALRMISTVSKQ